MLDPQMSLEQTAMRDRDAAPDPIEPEPQVNYADEHEHSHVTYLDGSAMIHAAFAAQAIELAEKEREQADRHDSSADIGHAGGGQESVLHDYPYSSGDQTRSELDIHEIPPLEDLQRSNKRRKTASKFKTLKGKGKLAGEDAYDSVALDMDPSATHDDIWSTADVGNMPLGIRRHESASKRQTTTSSAARKQSHIEAEQKRRAAIKSGYEALYRVIPALRDADLKEGKDRGGSGPGGGGARATRTVKLLGDEVHRQTSETTNDAGTSPANWSREHSVGEVGDDANLADCTQTGSAKSHSRRQKHVQHGKPLRPGVRSILPLVRQPGSEVTDGRQGPRSESVVLQQSKLGDNVPLHHSLMSLYRKLSRTVLATRTGSQAWLDEASSGFASFSPPQDTSGGAWTARIEPAKGRDRGPGHRDLLRIERHIRSRNMDTRSTIAVSGDD